MVPCHPEPVEGDPQTLRWVVPAGTLGFVGAVAQAPAGLQALVDDGTVHTLVAEPAAVRIRLAPGHGWRREGHRVRQALDAALVLTEQWHPNEASTPDDVLRAAAEQVVRGDVGDYIRSHGGGLSIQQVRDGSVTVELSGACTHCPAAELTLAGRFEAAVRELYPELRGVIAREPARAEGRRHRGLVPLRLLPSRR